MKIHKSKTTSDCRYRPQVELSNDLMIPVSFGVGTLLKNTNPVFYSWENCETSVVDGIIKSAYCDETLLVRPFVHEDSEIKAESISKLIHIETVRGVAIPGRLMITFIIKTAVYIG